MDQGTLRVVWTVPAVSLLASALNNDEQRLDAVVRRYHDLETKLEAVVAARDRVTRLLCAVAQERGVLFAELVSDGKYGVKLTEGVA